MLDQTSVHAPTDLPVTAASKVKADRIFVKYSHIDTKPNPASLAGRLSIDVNLRSKEGGAKDGGKEKTWSLTLRHQ